jgi:hypothetical protein
MGASGLSHDVEDIIGDGRLKNIGRNDGRLAPSILPNENPINSAAPSSDA